MINKEIPPPYKSKEAFKITTSLLHKEILKIMRLEYLEYKYGELNNLMQQIPHEADPLIKRRKQERD